MTFQVLAKDFEARFYFIGVNFWLVVLVLKIAVRIKV